MIEALVLLSAAANPPVPARTPLASIPISPAKTVSRVETTRVDFAPGRIMPRHKHTVPVICFVTKGAFLTNIGEEGERQAHTGDVTFEPAGVVVRYFQNASRVAPAQLECASLADTSDTRLNIMLDDGEN